MQYNIYSLLGDNKVKSHFKLSKTASIGLFYKPTCVEITHCTECQQKHVVSFSDQTVPITVCERFIKNFENYGVVTSDPEILAVHWLTPMLMLQEAAVTRSGIHRPKLLVLSRGIPNWWRGCAGWRKSCNVHAVHGQN
jgi:hypothetical protein